MTFTVSLGCPAQTVEPFGWAALVLTLLFAVWATTRLFGRPDDGDER